MQCLNRCRLFACYVAVILLSSSTNLRAQDVSTAAQPTQEQLEQAFADRLSGASLQGFFTITGRQNAEQPELLGERYDLLEVRKLEGNSWLFRARIRYGDHDVTLPMTLPVEWAGDTPVVVVDNIGFPGLGTYSARVLFHQSHYAGHWQGGDHGGHLFGTIERTQQEEAPGERPTEDDS